MCFRLKLSFSAGIVTFAAIGILKDNEQLLNHNTRIRSNEIFSKNVSDDYNKFILCHACF
jgi:hypothetical protein